MDIKKELPGVKENVLLKNHTTFKIGGKAKYFFVAKNKKDIIKAVLVAKKFKLPFFILGGGSNILVADEGFKGLVIKCQMSNVKCQNQNSKLKNIYMEAGVPLAFLVSMAVKKGLTGLEWAIGIPGTVGGAIYGNAGAFGKSMEKVVKEVEVLDTKDLRFKIYDLKKCKFGYRDSVFKEKKNLVILSAKIQLKKGKKSEIKKKMKEYLEYRKRTQSLNFPSAGSVFKNPSLTQVFKKFGRASGFSAGELIEKCGLKGKKIGKAKISEKHANFIVDLGGAKAKDVITLINLVKKEVKSKFGIYLEEEIQYLGY